jgi:predicted regulator of Ras-like GTPase activity (Roadblock/LC7/MglB family)
METVLRRLLEIEGVTGALFIGRDGLVVASTLTGEEEELLGAMVAACFDSCDRYIEQLGMGPVRYALFETPGGLVQAADAGEVLIAARSTLPSGIGRVRLELQQAAQRMAQEMGGR